MAEPMRYSTPLKTYDVFLQAFVNDPVQLYLWEDILTCPRWKTWLRQWFRRIRLAYFSISTLHSGLAYEVGGGKGFVLASHARADMPTASNVIQMDNPLSLIPVAIGKAYDRFVWPLLSTHQQRRRATEIESKMEATIASIIGDDGDQYMSLSHLACAPELQGRGLGKALVRSITDVADSRHRKVWLISSNARNDRFYRSCGFEIVGEIVLDSSPLVVARMMIYEPRQH